ncbi:MAG: nitroreductase family protein [Candidatus Aenigmarchaeota archaeon]|nr:nitroreductase family protein [Candidatus Aenigmarchaeota archaeon]
MNFFDAVTSRKPVKKYEDKKVDDKFIGVMLYMANQAESAGDLQAWEFVVVKNEDVKKKLYEAALKLDVVKNAPVDIVVCADLRKFSMKYHERGEYLYSIQDTASAITVMMITAEILGLGTNWVRAFDEDKVKQILSLPPDIRPVGILTVGYPTIKVETKRKTEYENLAWLDNYKSKYPLSYMFQHGAVKWEEGFKPIGNQIIDKIKKKGK